MCFQGYAHLACGCMRMFEEDCEEYTKLDDVPFPLKIACPNYRIARRTSPLACGRGGLYCAYAPDAAYLNSVQEYKRECETRLTNLDNYIDQHIHPARRVAMAVLFQKHGGDENKIKEDYMNDANNSMLEHRWATLLDMKKLVNAKLAQAGHVLHYSHQFYLLQRQGQGHYPIPQLPDTLRGLEMTPMAQLLDTLTQQHVKVVAADPARAAACGLTPSSVQPAQPRRSLSVQQLGPMRPPPNYHKEKEPRRATRASTSESPQKRGRKLRQVESDFPSIDDYAPRRSTRVRGKKINYDESSDEVRSRTPSPQKSDASSYSPSKSDVFDNGFKATRAGSSLRDMIGEFQKQANAATPTRSRRSLGTRSESSESSGQRGTVDTVPKIRVESPRSDTPQTDILAPHTGLQRTSLPQLRQGHENDPALAAFRYAYQQTHQAGLTKEASYSSEHEIMDNLPEVLEWEQQQRRQVGNIIPPNQLLPPRSQPSANEPTKRPSSPPLGSNKKARLSHGDASLLMERKDSARSTASRLSDPEYLPSGVRMPIEEEAAAMSDFEHETYGC